MSRDGGLTWFEIAKGSHIYEISDHGGLIIMADDQKAVNKIHYSWNEGISWNEVVISEDPIDV
jgi:Sortilin, neurotensin receptor 3,